VVPIVPTHRTAGRLFDFIRCSFGVRSFIGSFVRRSMERTTDDGTPMPRSAAEWERRRPPITTRDGRDTRIFAHQSGNAPQTATRARRTPATHEVAVSERQRRERAGCRKDGAEAGESDGDRRRTQDTAPPSSQSKKTGTSQCWLACS